MKRSQTLTFGELAPQNFKDSSMVLEATASSGLAVGFSSSDSSIAKVEGEEVQFVSIGTVYITAHQRGNEEYYEAANIVRELRIRDWDPDKLSQTIHFELPASRSNEDPPLALEATASSGLPVSYTSSDRKGQITADNYFILYHGPYRYELTLTVTAWQEGDERYNPAENVSRTLRAIGEGTH
jgi:hypothetical protein